MYGLTLNYMKRIVISLDHLESKLFIRCANHLDLS